MKVSTSQPATAPVRGELHRSHRGFDIAGILTFALAIVILVALVSVNSGILGSTLGELCRMLFGSGAWIAPPLLATLGISLVKGRSPSLTHLSWGMTLIFLAVIGVLARTVTGDFFDPVAIKAGGGYVGAVIGWCFASLLGAAKPVGLSALGLIGLVLCVDVPIRVILAAAGSKAMSMRRRALGRSLDIAKSRQPSEERVRSVRKVLERASGEQPPRAKSIVMEDPEPEPDAFAEPPSKTKDKAQLATKESSGHTLSSDLPVPKEGYDLPPISLLAEALLNPKRSQAEMQKNIETLEGTLEQFGIEASVVEVATGPTVTRYEIQLGPGIRVARITALADNIAMDLAASQVRVEAPIPGKATMAWKFPTQHPL